MGLSTYSIKKKATQSGCIPWGVSRARRWYHAVSHRSKYPTTRIWSPYFEIDWISKRSPWITTSLGSGCWSDSHSVSVNHNVVWCSSSFNIVRICALCCINWKARYTEAVCNIKQQVDSKIRALINPYRFTKHKTKRNWLNPSTPHRSFQQEYRFPYGVKWWAQYRLICLNARCLYNRSI